MHIATTETPAQPFPAGALLSRLGQEANARFRRALRPLDLGAQQFIALKQLEAMGAASQAALADAVGIDYSNLASVSAELCDRGLIAALARRDRPPPLRAGVDRRGKARDCAGRCSDRPGRG